MNESRNDSMRLIYGYNVLGNIYSRLDDFENAEAYYLKALGLNRALPEYRQESVILNNLSAMFCNLLDKSDIAVDYANEGLKAIETDDMHDLRGYLLANIGGAYDAVKNQNEAFRYYHSARELLEKEKAPINLDELYISLANLHLILNNPDSTYYYAGKAKKMANKFGSTEIQSRALMSLSKADSIHGDYRSALINYQRSIALRDSVWNLQNKNRIAELKIIYETDIKTAENQLLSEQNQLKTRIIRNQRHLIYAISLIVALIIFFSFREYTVKRKILAQKKEIAKKNEQLTDLNRTKDRFFSIIAHDLR